jgi:bifunctional non-homologous end joining protein LigD
MLLEEAKRPFDSPEWLFELKYDGYRLLAEFGGGKARLKTRNGADATRWFPEVARGLASVPGGPHITDGEVCVLDEHGRSDFDKLHERAKRRRWYAGCDPVAYCVFDLLVLAGRDITGMPLLDRKARLTKLLTPAPEGVLVVGHFDGESEQLFEGAVLQLGLEGLVGKRKASPYLPGVRSLDWVKIKRKGATPAQRFNRGPNKTIS